MKSENNHYGTTVTAAVEAIDNILEQELNEVFHRGQTDAMFAHDEIGLVPVTQKSGIFYRHFGPARNQLISLLTKSYRQYFKVALAHRREVGTHPEQWAWNHLLPAVGPTMEWICEWYVLACEGENQYIQRIGSTDFIPGQTISLSIPLSSPPSPPTDSWRAPTWLFEISPTLGFIRPLKTKHAPAINSEERLGVAHTRLLLKLARRVFLWALETAIEKVRNEETAASGAIPAQIIWEGQPGKPKKPKHWLKGIEGLTRKSDLSQYKRGLTERQELAFSLKYEYQLGPAEIAARMGIDRKTAHEHIEAANRKIKQLHSNDKRKANRSKNTPDL
jgi:hypothetical protein